MKSSWEQNGRMPYYQDDNESAKQMLMRMVIRKVADVADGNILTCSCLAMSNPTWPNYLHAPSVEGYPHRADCVFSIAKHVAEMLGDED